MAPSLILDHLAQCDKFSLITFSFLTRWLRNFAKNNRCHSVIVRNILISLMVNISWETELALKRTLLFKENRVYIKKLLIFCTEISGIVFYWYNKYSGEISEKSLEHVTQNSAVKLFWNFKNKLLSSRRSHQFEFSGQVNSMFANSENKSRLPIVLFFKRYFLVLEAP